MMAALEDYLMCRVCMDRYQSPKRLPCPHSYCRRCLEGLAGRGQPLRRPEGMAGRGQHTLTCPECRIEHVIPDGGIDAFPSDVRLAGLVAAMTQQDSGEGGTPAQLPRADDEKTNLRRRLNALEKKIPSSEMNTRIAKRKQLWIQSSLNLTEVRENINRRVDLMIDRLHARRMRLLTDLDPIALKIEQMTAVFDDVQDLKAFCTDCQAAINNDQMAINNDQAAINNDQMAELEAKIAQMSFIPDNIERALAMETPKVRFLTDHDHVISAIDNYGQIQ